MGGIAIVGSAALVGYLRRPPPRGRGLHPTGLLIMIVGIVGAGFVGLLDDWIKVRTSRNLGLSKKTKGWLAARRRRRASRCGSASRPTSRPPCRSPAATTPGWDLGRVAVGDLGHGASSSRTTNAVNLTDGLDGLAAGSVALRLHRLHRHRLLGASATPTSTRS